MALPDNTHSSGTAGTVFPTELVGTNEYPVGMVADYTGHIQGSLPAYGLVIPTTAVGANKIFFDLWNGSSASIIRVRKVFAIAAMDVAVAPVLGIRVDAMRTSAVGTGGTAATATGASKTAATFYGMDTANAALPAGVSARAIPTGGATDAQWLFPSYFGLEETNVATGSGGGPAFLTQYFNLLPELPNEQPLVLNVNQGLKLVQGAVASAGNIAFLVYFTVQT